VTVIVGIETDDGVVLGADRSCTWPDLNQIATYSYPKLFEYGPFLIGGCGSPRSMDLLRGCSAGDDWKPERAVHYLANAYRKALIDGGGIAKWDDGTDKGDSMLVAYAGQLYRIDDQFDVLQLADRYDAIGCGAPFALGALRIMSQDVHRWPDQNLDTATHWVMAALHAAAHHSFGVRGPFDVHVQATDAVR
jgi:20S proteasome alpha/beta subunit